MTLVTDLDAGAETGEGVSHDEVLQGFAANVDRLRGALFDAMPALPANEDRDCVCTSALGGMNSEFTVLWQYLILSSQQTFGMSGGSHATGPYRMEGGTGRSVVCVVRARPWCCSDCS